MNNGTLDNGNGTLAEIAVTDTNNKEIDCTGVFLSIATVNCLLLATFLAAIHGRADVLTGLRIYTWHLTMVNSAQIFTVAWAQQCDHYRLQYATAVLLQYLGVGDHLADGFLLYKLDSALLEWTITVWFGALTVLVWDSAQRYRNRGVGLTTVGWLLTVFGVDVLALITIFMKYFWFDSAPSRPQSVLLLLLLPVFGLLHLAIIANKIEPKTHHRKVQKHAEWRGRRYKNTNKVSPARDEPTSSSVSEVAHPQAVRAHQRHGGAAKTAAVFSRKRSTRYEQNADCAQAESGGLPSAAGRECGARGRHGHR